MLLSSSTIKIFCFVTMVFAFLLFFEFYDCNTGIALAKFTETVGCDMLLVFQVIVYTFSKCAGSFTMDNTDSFQMSDISIIQIFVKLCNSFIYRFAKQVDLCGYMGCF